MAKSMKLNDITSYLSNGDVRKEVLDEFHKEFPLENSNKFIVVESIYKDSKRQNVCKCKNCGKIFFSKERYFGAITCPNCNKEYQTIEVNESREMAQYALVKKINDVFCIFRISRSYKISLEKKEYYVEGGENKHLDKPVECFDFVLYGNFFFSEKFGFREEYSPRTKYSRFWKYGRQAVPDDSFFVHNDARKELLSLLAPFQRDTLVEKFCLYNEQLDANKKQNKQVKSINTDDLVSNLDESFFKNKLAEFETDFSFGSITDIDMENIRWKMKCSCGNIFSGSTKNNGEYDNPRYVYRFQIPTKCPCCKKDIEVDVRPNFERKTSLVSYFETFEEGVVNRCFMITNYLDKEKDFEVREFQRIFFYPQKYVVIKETDGVWKKSRTPENMKGTISINTKEELMNIINNSFLSRTGLLQAWGLGEYEDFKVEKMGLVSKNSYLSTWYSAHWIELLEKSKLTQMVKDFLFTRISPVIDVSATDIYSLLGITKNAFKIARSYNFDKFKLRLVDKCCNLQTNFSAKDWLELEQTFRLETDINRFIDVCERTDTTIKRLKDYLQSCYDNQCIEKSAALNIFDDYYNMAKAVGFNLADSAIKFPNSLKKEHDKALFAYRVVQNELKKKQFVENSKNNKKYEFENKEFKVIVPMAPEEVVREGQLLNHCVSSYVSRIESGSTCICFIRKKDDIDTPFFTCEIYNNSLYQVKGFCNKYPHKIKDKELIEFINDWTAEKKLTQEYMSH